MPEKFSGGKYTEMITPMDEEGNRTKNDPDTANAVPDFSVPDPTGLMHGIDKGGKTAKGGRTPKKD
jgi:hypothetical protein